MSHALVIGGSGMLAEASLWLAGRHGRVTVIGRNRDKLNRLAARDARIHPVSADYYREDAFRVALRASLDEHGPWSLVVAWIHSQEERVLAMVSEERKRVADSPWSLFHVLGSSSNLDEIERDMIDLDGCDYHQVQLGFVIEGGRSRWLTHAEISGGVIHAIRTGAKRHLVGTLTPWSMRP
jgi:NAD(P)-dependent dehydrogenase (short-subunit alcohol dehydrogenase family)